MADADAYFAANDPALLSAERTGRPAFATDESGAVVWAGAAAGALIGAGGLDAVTVRTLARVAASGAPSILRLRLGALGRLAPLAFRARPLAAPGGARWLALEGLTSTRPAAAAHAISDKDADASGSAVEAARTEAPPPDVASAEDAEDAPATRASEDTLVDAQADLDAPPDPRRDLASPALARPAPADEACSDATPADDAHETRAGTQPGPNPRFVFEFDAETRLVFLSRDLDASIGSSAAWARGRRWSEIAERFGLDVAGDIAAALGHRGGWSGLEVDWPTDSGRPARLALSALPIFDRGRTFVGFRGLGQSVEQSADETGAAVDELAAAETSIETAEPAPTLTVGDETHVTADPPPEPGLEDLEPVARPAGAQPDLRQPDEAPRLPVSLPALPRAADPFPENVVPLRMPERPQASILSATEEDAFDEIARRLGAFGTRLPEPAAHRREPPVAREPVAPSNAPETAEISAAPAADADWTLDDVDGHAPTASRVEDLLRLIDRLPIGALVLRAGDVAYANRATIEMLGAPDLAGLMARGGPSLFAKPPPRDDAAPATTRLVAADGVEIEVEARMSPLVWGGAPATLVSLKRAEGAVAAAQSALERELEASAILEVASDGVLTLDGAGRILSVNRPAAALFGFEAREAVGSLFTLSLAPESRRAAFECLDQIKTDPDGASAAEGREVMGLARQGGAIPLHMTISRVGPPDANRFCAVLRDITPWKKAEEELLAAKRQAERASAHKSEFLAKVSHEIRTPLNAIIGFSEIMMEERFGPSGSPRYKDYARDIHASGGHLIGLVNDLLDLSRIESGGAKLDFSAVDLNEIAQQAALLLQPQASRDHVIIRTSLARGLPPVLADRRSVRQILTNLASNAVRLSRPGGQVIVATAFTDIGQAVIRVRDAGLGMTRQELARAMEPFRPLGAADNDAGAALCLPLTKALAEANEAGFALQSELGQGTLAEVTFPASRVLAG